MTAERPICVLLAALGGQGGGLLVDWLVAAARCDGYPAQATSIPGVAQRTGATTYYFELFPQQHPPRDPVFSLYPSAGDVDLVAALEPTEAARALSLGYVGRNTVVVTARARAFSTAEKMMPGDGTIAVQPVLEALARAGKRLIAIDLRSEAAHADNPANAVIFGAMAETGVLPLTLDACRSAIEQTGVAADANLSGFEAGTTLASGTAAEPTVSSAESLILQDVPAPFANDIVDLPEPLRAIAGHGLSRLVDYQDTAYARTYLERLRAIVAADTTDGFRLSQVVARRLAAWMSFEDVIRVAQLKTRPGRFARIRTKLGVDQDAPLTVVDFLKPGREEAEGVLPPVLARLLPSHKGDSGQTGVALRVKTSSASGYLMFRALAALRPWRRRSERFKRENAAIDTWLAAIGRAARCDPDLALDTANAAVWVRGYGDVRARGMARLDRLFQNWERRLADDPAAVAAAVQSAIAAAYNDPDGEGQR